MMLTLLAFFVTIGLVVVVHEYGHFQVARWCNVKILKFSIGMGRALWSQKLGHDQIEYAISAIPLGGYVKMLDERELTEDELLQTQDLHRSFNRQAVWMRIAIVLAGPIANFLLAILLFWALLMSGVTEIKPILGDIVEGSPAFASGLHKGDVIQRIDGQNVKSWQDLRWLLLDRLFKTSPIDVEIININHELRNYQLDVSHVRQEDLDADLINKIGLSPYRPSISPTIQQLVEGGVAKKIGLQENDLILSINDVAMANGEGIVKLIQANANVKLLMRIQRAGKTLSLEIVPEPIKIQGKVIGRIGAGFKVSQEEIDKLTVHVDYSMLEAGKQACLMTWDTSILSLKMMWRMIQGEVSLKSMSGPIGVADVAGKSASVGLKAFVGFIAFVSISIGIFNLLPIPVLDGGHLMYYIAEVIKGSPVSETVMRIGQQMGILLLGTLFFVAIFNDIMRLIS